MQRQCPQKIKICDPFSKFALPNGSIWASRLQIIAQFGRNEVLRFQEFGKIITVQTGRKSKEEKSPNRKSFANKCHRGLPNIHLLVDQVCGNRIFCGIVPGGKDFFPEEKPPGGVALLSPLLFGVLLALGYSIHHVVSSTAQ